MKFAIHLALLTTIAAACSKTPSRPSLGAKDGADSTEGGSVGGGGDQGNGGADVGLNISFNTALPRLTHEEWENSVRDVFLLSARPNLASKFSTDDNSTIFHNDADKNLVTTNLRKDYQEASEEIGKRLAGDANLVKKLTEGAPAGETLDRAKAVLKPIILRAYRRPASAEELNALAQIYLDGKKLTGGTAFDAAGLNAVAAAIIQSPQFIYHPEFGTKEGELAKLSSYEVASRLSYAIWKTIPDAALFAAAEANKLATEDEIRNEVKRMFKDEKATNTLRYFLNELFETKKFVNLSKNSQLYPKFPNDLGDTLKKEAEMFIEDVAVKNNGGITKLLTESYTFVNDKTAPLYDVALPGTMELTKVDLDPKKRAGLVTQIGWLASNATSERTSTIHRGFYVMNRLACDSLPPMVGSDSKPTTQFKTRRDEVNAKTASCGAQCHNNYINPPAFALEAFDAAGVWRDKEGGNIIDTSGVYGEAGEGKDAPTKFKDVVELMKGITKRTSTHECFVSRAIELLYNRRVNDLDRSIIQRLGKESLEGMGTRDILIELLSDPELLTQRSDNG